MVTIGLVVITGLVVKRGLVVTTGFVVKRGLVVIIEYSANRIHKVDNIAPILPDDFTVDRDSSLDLDSSLVDILVCARGHKLRCIDMEKSDNLDDLRDDIEDYYDDEFLDDDMSYLNLDADSEFEDYLDHRASRKSNRKGRGKRDVGADTTNRNLPDDWEDFKYG